MREKVVAAKERERWKTTKTQPEGRDGGPLPRKNLNVRDSLFFFFLFFFTSFFF